LSTVNVKIHCKYTVTILTYGVDNICRLQNCTGLKSKSSAPKHLKVAEFSSDLLSSKSCNVNKLNMLRMITLRLFIVYTCGLLGCMSFENAGMYLPHYMWHCSSEDGDL
jgi:hypothetical protein